MKIKFIHIFILLLLVSISNLGLAQDSLYVEVYGRVVDTESGLAVPNLMVVNKRSQRGFFGDNDGEYSIRIKVGDQLIFAATGYTTLYKNVLGVPTDGRIELNVNMNRLSIKLKPVEIFTKRDLREIQKDIEKLGYDKKEDMLSGVDAFSSPITYLYQQFSRRERNKRQVAEWRNNDRRRELLKELFRKYVDEDIISLDESEFDAFIDFTRVNDEFLKNSTQYEFIMYIKKRFEVYQAIKDM